MGSNNALVGIGIGKATDTLFENPLLSILTKNMEVYNTGFSNKKTIMAEMMTRKFNDECIAMKISAAKSEAREKKMPRSWSLLSLKCV
ncbi:hypothetical protein GQ600_25168 [Phytophthora cactorum]|nr:hypothetical protein GQ600_25168 [Phytophthora cactorum]